MCTWESYLSPLSFNFLDFKMGDNNSTTSEVVRIKLEIMALIISSTINNSWHSALYTSCSLESLAVREAMLGDKPFLVGYKAVFYGDSQEGVNRKTKSWEDLRMFGKEFLQGQSLRLRNLEGGKSLVYSVSSATHLPFLSLVEKFF